LLRKIVEHATERVLSTKDVVVRQMEANEINKVALDALRVRITKVLPAQIKSCLQELNSEQLWWRPNEQSNSIGNLTLHVCGATMHFLCRGVGGHEYSRDRPAEFATRSMSKEQLIAILDETNCNRGTHVRQAQLGSAERSVYRTNVLLNCLEDLFGVAIHVAVHTGQIVYLTKLLKEGSIEDLWAQTHRSLGAWKK
jgi:hypothetical protein